MSEELKCGHDETCTYSYMKKGIRYKYCLACICEASGIKSYEPKPVARAAIHGKGKPIKNEPNM